jgi:nicotinamidase-related amidase
MANPRTILDLAGAAPAPHALSNSAVVMIDAQMEYVTGLLPLDGVETALEEGGRLLAAARQAGRPIIHVQQKGRPGGLFDPEGPSFPIAGAVAPQGGEPVVVKGLPNAFSGTELEDVLKEAGAESVIFAGFMTHMCVSSTVRNALDRGVACTVLASACATRDLPDGRGGVVTAAELHRAELAALSDRFCPIAENLANLKQ